MREINNIELLLVNLGIANHNADWNWQNVSSPFARIFYVREGKAKLIFPDCEYILKPGYIYLVPPFCQHSYECRDCYCQTYIHIYEKPTSKISLFDEYHLPIEIKANEIDSVLVDRLHKINPHCELSQYDPRFYDNQTTLLKNIAQRNFLSDDIILETRGILLQIISRFIAGATSKTDSFDERITKAIAYIRRNLDKQIKREELAGLCHLSNDHFIRLFKKELNCTPVMYINQKKIEKAQLMLTISEIPVKDVAYRLSFETISYFNKLFKSITTMTPTQYLL